MRPSPLAMALSGSPLPTTPPSQPMTSSLAVARFSYFPSLVFQFDLPDAVALNEQLLTLISAVRKADEKGVEKSNDSYLGGWHSREILHKLPGFEPLVGYINKAGEHICGDLQYDKTYDLRIGSMWSIINPPGAYNLAHVHPRSLWSGVYYVQAPHNCGRISFTDPRPANVMTAPRYIPNQRAPRKCWTKVCFSPVAGRMLVFPSWLSHSVEPNRAIPASGCGHNGDRVIVSFNLSQQAKKQAYSPLSTLPVRLGGDQ